MVVTSLIGWVCLSRATARVAPTFLLMERHRQQVCLSRATARVAPTFLPITSRLKEGRHRQQVCLSRATARVAPTFLPITSRSTEHWSKTARMLLFTTASCCLCSSENWVPGCVKLRRHSTQPAFSQTYLLCLAACPMPISSSEGPWGSPSPTKSSPGYLPFSTHTDDILRREP